MQRPLSVLGHRWLLAGAVLVLDLAVATLVLVRGSDPVAPDDVGAWRELPAPPVAAARGSLLGWTGGEVLVVGGTASPAARRSAAVAERAGRPGLRAARMPTASSRRISSRHPTASSSSAPRVRA